MAHVRLDPQRTQQAASSQTHTHARAESGEQARRRLPQAHLGASEAVASPRPAHDFGRIPVLSKAPVSLQHKLAVGDPDDAFEREADRVAEHVMSTPEPRLQRSCACGGSCSECGTRQKSLPEERLQSKSAGSGEPSRDAAPPAVERVLASPGQTLDPEARAFFEPRFGHDFSRVRVHSDAEAGQSARAVNALAYTVGRDVVFGAGLYAPGTHEGRRLIAHELAHVVQQGGGAAAAVQRDVDETEHETHNADEAPIPLEDPPAKTPDKTPDKAPAKDAAPAPSCAEKVNWTPQPAIPVEITADTAVDFVNKINGALGGNPHTEIEPSFDAETTDGKVTKVNFTLKTTIRRPRYGGGRATDEEKALIGRIVDFIKAHEERHRDLARSLAQKAVCDALGQPAAAGRKILNDAICNKMPTAQETLDGSEGKIELTSNNKDFKAVGVKVNYHDKDCK